jgi:hypothetical protein
MDIEYDPANASLSPVQHHSSNNSFDRPQRGDRGGRGRGRGRGRGDYTNGSARGTRATFSSAAPNIDRTITSIVIEQIPEEKFNDASVHEFFTDFGTIEEVSMQAYKRLAVVRFSDYDSAKRAYESPKVIFDNRFVKVYWYKPESVKPGTVGGRTNGGAVQEKPASVEDTEMIDPEEFARKQAEAQRAHEEKAQKLKEAEAQKEEIAQKIRAAAEERKKLMEKLAAKTKTSIASPVPGTPAAASGEVKSEGKVSQTEALRLKLAELEAEAEMLGIPAEDPNQQFSPGFPTYRGRGRGAPYIPRGGYRGRGAPGFRGGWRGGAAAPGGAVARLDNRPRSVEVKALDDGVDFSDEKVGEALRVCLFVSTALLISRRSHCTNNTARVSATSPASHQSRKRTPSARTPLQWKATIKPLPS